MLQVVLIMVISRINSDFSLFFLVKDVDLFYNL